jgi:hypothetical protein
MVKAFFVAGKLVLFAFFRASWRVSPVTKYLFTIIFTFLLCFNFFAIIPKTALKISLFSLQARVLSL